MNENTPYNSRFTDDQMEKLLSTFYKKELPADLDRLPLTWPNEIRDANQRRQPTTVTTVQTYCQPSEKTKAGRGLVVAAATLAACLMVLVVSNLKNPATDSTPTANRKTVIQETPDALMDVSANPTSANPGGGAVDEHGMTVEELDVDLNPGKPSSAPPKR
jgi:hypothetical protein